MADLTTLRDPLDDLMDSHTSLATGGATVDPLDGMMDGYVSARRPPSAPAPGQAPNPYLDVLQAEADARATRLNATATRALAGNPDKYAQQKRVAQYLGYPTAAVEALPAQTEREAGLRRIQQAAQASPVLQKRYSDEDFARLAADDTDALSTVAAWFTNSAKYIVSAPDTKNTLAGTVGSAVLKANRGAAGLGQAAAELPAPLLDFLEATTPEQAAGWRGAVGGNPLRRLAEGFAGAGAESERRAKEMNPPVQGTVAGGVISGIESLVQNVLSLPLLFVPGGQAAYLANSGTIPGGPSFQEPRGARQ